MFILRQTSPLFNRFPPSNPLFLGLVLYKRIVYNKVLKVRTPLNVLIGKRLRRFFRQYLERKDVLMIQFKSDQGEISISSAVFSNITGMAATNCFGVKVMA